MAGRGGIAGSAEVLRFLPDDGEPFSIRTLPRTRSLRTWFMFDELGALHKLPAAQSTSAIMASYIHGRAGAPRIARPLLISLAPLLVT